MPLSLSLHCCHFRLMVSRVCEGLVTFVGRQLNCFKHISAALYPPVASFSLGASLSIAWDAIIYVDPQYFHGVCGAFEWWSDLIFPSLFMVFYALADI